MTKSKNIIAIRGYYPDKFSGKQKYVNFLLKQEEVINIYHDWNLLNLINKKITYLLRKYDLYILYSVKIFLYLSYYKLTQRKIKGIVIDSQENIFIIPIIQMFKCSNVQLIFYDFGSKTGTINQKYINLLNSFKKIIVLTNSMKRALIKKASVKANKIKVIYYKIDSKKYYKILNKNVLIRFAIKKHLPQKYILYVGSEQSRKNFFTLLEGYEKLINKFPNLYFIKIGKSQSYANRLKLFKKLSINKKMQEKFILIENCSDLDLNYYYNLATIFVFPSIYEGFGIPLLEAMACGLPIIASKIDTTIELCQKNVLYVDEPKKSNAFALKIEELLKNIKERQKISKLELNHIKELSY